MFDSPGPEALADADDAVVVGAIGDWERGESASAARRLAAIGELVARRCPADDTDPDVVNERSRWACDPWDATAAEVAAALGISSRRASSQMYLAQSLRERLPNVNALFLAGRIGARLVSTISWRTHCVVGAAEMAAIDTDIAKAAAQWGPLSDRKVESLIDEAVDAHDPDAREWFRQAARGMDVQFGKPDDAGGTRSVWGRLFATHAELIERRLTAIARAVCDADPRTVGQRRAEAMGAVFAGADRIACQCGRSDCPNPTSAALKGSVVIHVVADQSAVNQARAAASAGAGVQTSDTDQGQEKHPGPAGDQGQAQPPRRRHAALMVNGGVIPNPLLEQLIRDGAHVVPLAKPCETAEAQYRPSLKLQRFVRCRDLTCRFPGCDVPAEVCDVDHAIAYPLGPTHPSNLRCLCRKHHLLRTFWVGADGWSDKQLRDGTVVWTAPTGHTYTTHPGARMYFPDWDVSTGELAPVAAGVPEPASRSLQMPRRRRT
ncbi:MAG TPA: DUF222 domain-containing protein, partial [Mycobacterium sp.]|nr:DUF222 domain-containing protein [Mycobacterium sp.]